MRFNAEKVSNLPYLATVAKIHVTIVLIIANSIGIIIA